jgi:hypothetical protein
MRKNPDNDTLEFIESSDLAMCDDDNSRAAYTTVKRLTGLTHNEIQLIGVRRSYSLIFSKEPVAIPIPLGTDLESVITNEQTYIVAGKLPYNVEPDLKKYGLEWVSVYDSAELLQRMGEHRYYKLGFLMEALERLQ